MPSPLGRQPESMAQRARVGQWSREWSRKMIGFATNYYKKAGTRKYQSPDRAPGAKRCYDARPGPAKR
jgi:hypothetical protein